MTQRKPVRPSEGLANVRYEIRGKLARRALALERSGYDIVSLNIGNPYAFGFRTPETMRLAMIENLRHSEGYVHQKGIFPAREAVVMQQQERGVRGVTAEEVFIGNGVSELIDLTLRALLNPGDEVLVPSPDYPLWTAAVNLNTGRAVHYPCLAARSFIPDPQDIEALVTKRTRAIVIVNPNNPTGAVYPRETLAAIARLAEQHRLVVCVEDGIRTGGMGTAVVELLADHDVKTPAIRLGLPDSFLEHGNQNLILAGLGLDPKGIAKSVLEALKPASSEAEHVNRHGVAANV